MISQSSKRELRCAIYTRKSTSEGLEQEFNTLDAQREACQAYCASQIGEGWTCLSDHYDDGGFTGGNLERPALRRLMADIEAGKVDLVLVYKVDRLSRSLKDFLALMEFCQQHNVMFVSVTQAFNTATSMGRLMLNVLLSFAQFEREMVSERTRDKMGAARKKGLWLGGTPVLGYDVLETKLLVNETEAEIVRLIFALYQEHLGLIPVVKELDRRGIRNKTWITKAGVACGGRPFTKNSLHRLLKNSTYIGKTCYQGQIYEGRHAAIVDLLVWQQTQTLLAQNGRAGGPKVRNQFGSCLKGLLYCAACSCAMSPSHATRKNVRYRYYLCGHAQKHGRGSCPAPSLPAHEIEQVVINQVRVIGQDRALVAETLRQMQALSKSQVGALESEQRDVHRNLARWNNELQQTASSADAREDSVTTTHLADLQERIAGAASRAAEIQAQLDRHQQESVTDSVAIQALADFTGIWESLKPQERAELLQLLVERVDYDGVRGKVSVTFRPTGIQCLVGRFRHEEQVA